MISLCKKIGWYLSRYIMNDEANQKTDVCDTRTGPALCEKYSEDSVLNSESSECDYINSSDSESKYDIPHHEETSEKCHLDSSYSHPKEYPPPNTENSVPECIEDFTTNSLLNNQLTYSAEKLTDSGIKKLSTNSYQSFHSSFNTRTDFLKKYRPHERKIHMKGLSTNLAKDSSNKPSCLYATQKAVVENHSESCQNVRTCLNVKKTDILNKHLEMLPTKRKHCKAYEYICAKECRPCEVSLEKLSLDHIKCFLSIDNKRRKLDQDYIHSLSVQNAQLLYNVEQCDGHDAVKMQPVNMCAARKEINTTVFKKEYQPCVVHLERLSESLTKQFSSICDSVSSITSEGHATQHLNRNKIH